MTTNGKGVTKERLFAFVKETTALGKECGIVEKEGRQDQGQHRQHLSATRQVSAGPVQQRRREADGWRVCGSWHDAGRPAGRVCRPVSVPWRLRQDGRQPGETPGPPAQNTEKTENKSPATRSRGLFLENRTEPKHYRRP